MNSGRGEERIREYIQNHYDDSNLSLNSLSEGLGISERWMTEIFKEYYGITVSSYINKIRVTKAHELLRQGIAVKQVCEAVGFGNVRTFERVFRKYMGETPASVRRNLKEKVEKRR